jgi:hypothetical protein
MCEVSQSGHPFALVHMLRRIPSMAVGYLSQVPLP